MKSPTMVPGVLSVLAAITSFIGFPVIYTPKVLLPILYYALVEYSTETDKFKRKSVVKSSLCVRPSGRDHHSYQCVLIPHSLPSTSSTAQGLTSLTVVILAS